MYITVLKMTRNSILQATNLLDVNSSNSVHKWLTSQQDKSRAENKLLYKIISNKDEIYMYIQSETRFNIADIDKVGFEFVKEIDLNNVNIPRVCRFDVQTFPNKAINRKRIFLTDINDRINWLQRQFQKYDIELIECMEYNTSNIIFDKDAVKHISTASYRGKFIVNNPTLAKELFENGLGRFKNYGLGLILFK